MDHLIADHLNCKFYTAKNSTAREKKGTSKFVCIILFYPHPHPHDG